MEGTLEGSVEELVEGMRWTDVNVVGALSAVRHHVAPTAGPCRTGPDGPPPPQGTGRGGIVATAKVKNDTKRGSFVPTAVTSM